MNNYKLTVAYDGTRYRGWQVQGNTEQTIQGKLQAVISKMVGEEIELHGSGRTDAGVHAVGQTANFKTKLELEEDEIRDYMNCYLPEDISVQSVERVPEKFHSRLTATKKIYRYRIWTSDIPPVFERRYVTPVEERLDVNAMQQAAQYLVGTHDFMSFCGNRKFKKSSVRTIYGIQFQEKERELVIDVTGNGFLQNMMRILIGTLVDVGCHRISPKDMEKILEERNRDMAGDTMPAKGLCLMEVFYE